MTEDKDDNRQISEFELARQVRELEREITPERDLWAGIERRIQDHPQPVRRDWMPYAVAASLFVAVCALVLNIAQLNRAPESVNQLTALEVIDREYQMVRGPMVEEFTRVNHSLDEQTQVELRRNLEFMLQAQRDVHRQLEQDPGNPRLRNMLIRLHEQELELLRRDFTGQGRSL